MQTYKPILKKFCFLTIKFSILARLSAIETTVNAGFEHGERDVSTSLHAQELELAAQTPCAAVVKRRYEHKALGKREAFSNNAQ